MFTRVLHSGKGANEPEVELEAKPGVYYDSLTRTFRLRCKQSIYAFRVDDGRNLEHLYWGSSIPLEDDLLFLGFGNTPTPFDPRGYVGELQLAGLQQCKVSSTSIHIGSSSESPKMLGFSELRQLDTGKMVEKWRTYTVEAHDPDKTEPRRLENVGNVFRTQNIMKS
eukprot:jgi/Galph1/3130/GphlegSOOS_G1821.1